MTDWDDLPPLPSTPPSTPDAPTNPQTATPPPTGEAPTPPLGTSIAAPGDPVTAGSGGHGRDLLAATLAILAVVALFGANVSWWISHDVYDTTAVTAKASVLAASPDTQAALTALIEDKVVTPALQQAAGALPDALQSLGGFVQGQTAPLIGDAVASAVASQTTGEIATRLVGAINAQLVDGSGPIELTPTQLVAIAAPSLSDNRAVSTLVDVAERTGCCTVLLAERSDLPFVWQHVSLIRAAAVVLPIAALGLALAALAVGRRRLAVALGLAIGTAIAGALTLVTVWAGFRWGADRIGDPSLRSTALVRQAIRITSDVTVGDLRQQSWMLVAIGAIAAAVLAAFMVVRRPRKVPA